MKKLLLIIPFILAFLVNGSSLAWADNPDSDNLWFSVPLDHAPGIQDDAPTVGADKVRDSDRITSGDKAYFSFYYDHNDNGVAGELWYVNQKGVKTQCSIDPEFETGSIGPCATAPVFIAASGATICMMLEQPHSETMSNTLRVDLNWEVMVCLDKNCTSSVKVPFTTSTIRITDDCRPSGYPNHAGTGGNSVSGNWIYVKKPLFNADGNDLAADHIVRIWITGTMNEGNF
jgi:hypothetical protein